MPPRRWRRWPQADGITIEVAPHQPLPVVGDRDELIQVFQNLIHNAIKYGRAGGARDGDVRRARTARHARRRRHGLRSLSRTKAKASRARPSRV